MSFCRLRSLALLACSWQPLRLVVRLSLFGFCLAFASPQSTVVIHSYPYLPRRFGGWARSPPRVASALLESDLRTNVYVDGFNLYYGALRKTPHRWVNLESLFQLLLPKNKIQEIKYFTALVSARPNDLSQPQRQQLYLRALATLPKVSVHLGHFLVHEVTMPLVVAPGQPQRYVRVIKTEEKGSDVNLATHLLHDAHRDRFDVAVVVSNW